MNRFESPVIAASLSGESDSEWASCIAPFVGGAMLGGIAVDSPTRRAARKLVDRGRTEFLPADPRSFMASELEACADLPLRCGWNVRATSPEAIREAATVCAAHDAILEVNAHCRQAEMCAVGAGERLLQDTDRLREQVWAAATAGATVSVKVRTEVDGVNLPSVAAAAETAGADIIHIDAMDSESVVAEVVDATDATVIANNGVRDRQTVREYVEYGADAVSLARPTDEPAVLRAVASAARELLGSETHHGTDVGAP